MVGDGQVKLRVDLKARQRAKDRLRKLTAHLARPDAAAHRCDQPLHGRVDGLLCVG